MPTSTVENYLKAIHHLAVGESDVVAVGGIAEELGVTPGTVTTMMKHLGGRGLVEYLPRRGVRLTATGREAAMKVLRRHRLVELFLVEVLGLDWAEVHAEAEGGESIGRITNSSPAPMLGSACVAFAMLKYASGEPGTRVRLAAEGDWAVGTVQPSLRFLPGGGA